MKVRYNMKLKSIKKLCSEVRYIISVFDENGRFIEDFKLDYVNMKEEELNDAIINHYFKYENCKVRHIDTRAKSDGTSWLNISVEI